MADPANDLVQGLLQYARPQDVPAIRRSQYLSDALQQLQATGAQQSKTPTALGSNLLALALLGHKDRKAFQSLYGGLSGNRDEVLGSTASSPVMQSVFGGAAPSLGQQQASAPQGGPPAPQGGGPINIAPPAPDAASGPPQGVAPPVQTPQAPPQQAPQPQASAGPPMMQVPDALKQQYAFYVQKYHATGQPQFLQMAQQFAEKIQGLATTQMKAPENMAWDPQRGAFAPMAGTQYTNEPGGPGVTLSVDPFGKPTAVNNGMALRDGRVWDPKNGMWAQPGTEAGGHVYPNGSPDLPALGKIPDQVAQAPQVFAYTNLRSKIANVFDPNFHEGNAKDFARIDGIVEAFGGNPTQKPTEGFFNKVEESMGIGQGVLARFWNETHGGTGGLITPNLRANLDNALQNTLQERYTAAKDYIDTVRHGIELPAPGQSQTLAPYPAAPPPSTTTTLHPLAPGATDTGQHGGAAPASAPQGSPVNPIHVTSPADVQRLPKGSYWVGPSGRMKGPT